MDCDFPLIISRLRKKKGISQKQVAKDLGISQALLSHYEKGIRECGLDFLIKVADYYKVSADYLLGISTEPPKPAETAEEIAAQKKRLTELGEQLNKIRRGVEKAEKFLNENFE